MRRGTTPDFVINLAGQVLTGMTVYVTIKQGGVLLTKTGDDLTVAVDAEGSTIAFSLTQQDTLQLHIGEAAIQVRFIDAEGNASASEIASIHIEPILLERVIEYDPD